MTNRSFSAEELYCMARMTRKKRMFGIPDIISAVPREERKLLFRELYDEMRENGLAEMNLDGKYMLREEYGEIPEICCGCEKCMTVTKQKADGAGIGYIFWKQGEKLFKAEAVNNRYLFSESTPEEAASVCTAQMQKLNSTADQQTAVIPQIALKQAKRAAMEGKEEESIRILRQNGAAQQIARAVCDGLFGKADYLGIVLMTNDNGETGAQAVNWLQSRDLALTAHTEIVNYRTCCAFETRSGEELNAEAENILSAFLKE